jgi:hypothetical protein
VKSVTFLKGFYITGPSPVFVVGSYFVKGGKGGFWCLWGNVWFGLEFSLVLEYSAHIPGTQLYRRDWLLFTVFWVFWMVFQVCRCWV